MERDEKFKRLVEQYVEQYTIAKAQEAIILEHVRMRDDAQRQMVDYDRQLKTYIGRNVPRRVVRVGESVVLVQFVDNGDREPFSVVTVEPLL